MNKLMRVGLTSLVAGHFPEDASHWLDQSYDYGWEGPPKVRCKCDTYFQNEDEWADHLTEVLTEALE